MVKIGIEGESFHGITGAEAMLITTIAHLRESLGEVLSGVFSHYDDDRLVFSWNHKNGEVMDQFELSDSVLDHQSIDAERLVRLINDTLERSLALSNRIEAQLTSAADPAKQGRI